MNEARFVVCRAGRTDTKYQGGANEMRRTRVTDDSYGRKSGGRKVESISAVT
jgi:hypothetical protein